MSEETTGAAPYLVFISHSSEDRWIAKQIARLIEQQGSEFRVRTFLDDDTIHGGDEIIETIFEYIRNCDEFVVLLTQYSIISQWVMMELGAAKVMHKRIVAIMDKLKKDDLPDILRANKTIQLNDFDIYLAQLAMRLQGGKQSL